MNQKAVALLNSVNLRQTQPRVAILTVLLKAGAPLSQEQIAEQIGTASPNKTTIYRNLMSLVDKNLVHQAYLEERTRHYELAHHCGKHQCHPHFTCSACQRTECLPEVSMPLVELPDAYVMQRQQVRVEGICRECQKKT